MPWERLTADEQAVARQNRGAIRNVRLVDIQLLEKFPPRSFLVNSGGELSGVTLQNLRQADRVLDRSADLGLSVEGATGYVLPNDGANSGQTKALRSFVVCSQEV